MKRIALGMLLVILLLYFANYVVLSSKGKYLSISWGLSKKGMYPKYYNWMPAGFYCPDSDEFHRPLIYLFYPMFEADKFYWHTGRGYGELAPNDPAFPDVPPHSRKRNDPTFRYSPPDSD